MQLMQSILCAAINADMESKRWEKRGSVEANWVVRNASICPLPYKPDSWKEDTSGHPIMQIPKVHWPLQPEGMLPLITRSYTERTCSIKKYTHWEYNTQDIPPISFFHFKISVLQQKNYIFLWFFFYYLTFIFSPFAQFTSIKNACVQVDVCACIEEGTILL